MSKSKSQKYYVVWHGHKPGIYTTWEECKVQTHQFPQARYKSFATMAEAEAAFSNEPPRRIVGDARKPAKPQATLSRSGIIKESISVDAACSGNPGDMEYRGVWTANGQELFRIGPYRDGTNNIGEFLAIVHALALLKKQNDDKTPIYSDSRNAILWVKKKKANTKLARTRHNEIIFDLIARAEKWLRENTWSNPLLKWETKYWGEIPADFGRK
jgi:ribonuclease HI